MAEKPALKLVDVDENYQGPDIRQATAANLIKEGRKRALKDNAAKIAKGETVAALEAAHAAELQRVELQNAREEKKHAIGNRWRGRAEGAVIALVLVSLVFVLVIREMTAMAFQEAQQATQQGALVGAAAANQDPERITRPVPYSHGAREPGDAPAP